MKRIMGVGLLVAVLALATACGTAPTAPTTPTAPPGQAAPAGGDQLGFTATTLDGREFSGQQLAGQPAVLWFWAPWCTICQREAPAVARAAQAHPSVRFVGVAAQDQIPAMQAFANRFQLAFTQLADIDASVWRRFGVTQQPAFAFIGPDGRADVVPGTLTEQELAGRLTALAGPG